MTRAVIYARYSSESQTEQSIEGQVGDCLKYAGDHGLTVVNQYIDRAKTGRSDDRPAFQTMIRDASVDKFDIVLVWKLDRFSRNLYQSYLYEDRLAQNNVKLVSVMEPISEGAAGTITKGLFRVMAQYYSEDLREKVIRGMGITARKGNSTGGTLPLGYRVVDHKLAVNPDEAGVVREVFRRYADGQSLLKIAQDLNARGIRTRRGGLINKNTFCGTLRNPKYIGVYHYNNNEVVIEDAVPPIVDRETWDAVQRRLARNAQKSARSKAKANYLLVGKIFCGKCGHLMGGESTRKQGYQYNYYACCQKKKYRACDKKNVQKQWIEDIVIKSAVDLLTDETIKKIVTAAAREVEQSSGRREELAALRKQLRDEKKRIDNMVSAIASGLISDALSAELRAAEQTATSLEASIAITEASQTALLDVDVATAFLYRFRGGDVTDPQFRQDVCDILVNRVIVYDDRIDIYYNYDDRDNPPPKTVPLDGGNFSNLTALGAPNKANSRLYILTYCFVVSLPIAGRR